MQISPFGVEIWMNAHETRCRHNLAETCVAAMTLGELLDLCGATDDALTDLRGLHMTYGDIEGSDRLRRAIAGLYRRCRAEQVLVTHGTIGANDLVWRSLVGPGDHVIILTPVYQQHVSLPEALGAQVTEMRLHAQTNWLPDMAALRALVRDNTKVIAFTNPGNPTGSLIPEPLLREICNLADEAGATVFADEVYRGTAQQGSGWSPSVVDLSPNAVATAGMSKAYSLAGLRLGWVTAPDEVLQRVSHHRDYTTISVGRLDDHFAALALENVDRILARSHRITRANLAILADWVEVTPGLSWARPVAGTTCLLRYDHAVASEELCKGLLAETGVLLVPGAIMGAEGHVRLGFANRAEDLHEGLPLLASYLAALPRSDPGAVTRPA